MKEIILKMNKPVKIEKIYWYPQWLKNIQSINDKEYSIKKNNLHIEDIFKEFKIPDLDDSLRHKSNHYYIKDKIDKYIMNQCTQKRIEINGDLVDDILFLKEYCEYLRGSEDLDSPNIQYLIWIFKDRCSDIADYLYKEQPVGFEKALILIKYFYKSTWEGYPEAKQLINRCYGWLQHELKNPESFGLPSIAEQKLEIAKELGLMDYEILWYYDQEGMVFSVLN